LNEIESIEEKNTIKLILDKNNIPINVVISHNLKSKNILDMLILSNLSKKFTISEKEYVEEDKDAKDLKIFEKSNAFNLKNEFDKKEITITINSIKKIIIWRKYLIKVFHLEIQILISLKMIFLLYLDIFILKKYHKFFILGTKEILNWINQMILIDYNNKTYMTCFLPITN